MDTSTIDAPTMDDKWKTNSRNSTRILPALSMRHILDRGCGHVSFSSTGQYLWITLFSHGLPRIANFPCCLLNDIVLRLAGSVDTLPLPLLSDCAKTNLQEQDQS